MLYPGMVMVSSHAIYPNQPCHVPLCCSTYIRQKTIGLNFYDAYKIESSGLVDEEALLTGLSEGFASGKIELIAA